MKKVLVIIALFCAAAAPSRACTSFCFDAPGGPVFATNLDLATGDGHVFVNRRGIAKQGYSAGVDGGTAHWVAAYGSVTFNLVGRELPWGGMNEAGLVISTMQLKASRCPDPDGRPPLGEAYLVQYVLDTCGSVAEAVEAAAQVRLAQHECTSHYLLADAGGDCATIEFLDGEYVYHTGAELPVRALANASYAAGVDYIERGVVPADNPGASVERVAAAAARAAAFRLQDGVAPVDYAFAVLTEDVAAPKRWWSNWFDEPYTRWNVVFDVARREVHFRTADVPEVRRLSLHSFDFACEAPLLMLDVNAELEGSIDGAFGPYDHDANLEIFRTFCDDWGIEVSEEDAVGLVELFESFECSR